MVGSNNVYRVPNALLQYLDNPATAHTNIYMQISIMYIISEPRDGRRSPRKEKNKRVRLQTSSTPRFIRMYAKYYTFARDRARVLCAIINRSHTENAQRGRIPIMLSAYGWNLSKHH